MNFWDKVDQSGDCWIWTGYVGHDGYGQHGRSGKAHRLAWELTVGPIPDGLNVLHRCDTPVCVRPEHLFLGTSADNSIDMVRKGRQWKQKITYEMAEMIRETHRLGVSQREIARSLEMHHQTIWRVIHRKGVV